MSFELIIYFLFFFLFSRYLLVPSGSSVKVIEVESGLIRRVLSVGNAEITQVLFNPLKGDSQIISCAVDGNVCVWDWQSGELVRSFRTKHPMHSMLVRSCDPEKETIELFTVSLRLKGPLGCNLPDPRKLFNYCGQLTTSLIEQVKLDLSSGAFTTRKGFKARGMARLALSPLGDELAFTSLDEIRFCRLNAGDLEVSRVLKHSSTITRLQYHPREPCMVLSDRHGQIVLWYCLSEDCSAASYPQRTLHWHANEVTDLAFTGNGQYLLSGGEEAVLVLWQIESNLRQYLPRLGDAIHFVSVSGDDRWIAVSTRDNAIHFVSLTSGSTLTVSRSIRGCQAVGDGGFAAAIASNGVTSEIILPGNPGSLQVYDPIRDAVQDVLEISPQNRLTGFTSRRGGRGELRVVKTALSSCGRWMVTVEQRDSRRDPMKSILTCRLKFWGLQDETGESDDAGKTTWVLLSMIDRPHVDLLTDLCIWSGPSGVPCAASTSRDGTFKLWSVDMRHGIWSCSHSGTYHDVSSGAGSVSVNAERTHLAITYGASITIWQLKDSGVLLVDVLMTSQGAKLSEARYLSDGSLVAWCPDSGTFVFNASESGVNLKLKLAWHSPVSPIAGIAVHPSLAQFGMLVDAPNEDDCSGVLTYESRCPVPIGYFLLPERSLNTCALVYVPSPASVRKVRPDSAASHLMVVVDGQSGEFTLLGAENASRLNRSDFKLRIKPHQLPPTEQMQESSRLRAKSLYAAIFDSVDGLTQDPLLDRKSQAAKHSMAELFTSVPQISSESVLLPLVPSHLLPPIGLLFSNYIQKILVQRK
jgi:NET1-associated nuclear protein 1 (U3 small nucleolar RNA-associated protein 17)